MARARIVYQAADGSATEVEFEARAGYPDGNRDVVGRVLDIWRGIDEDADDSDSVLERLELEGDGE